MKVRLLKADGLFYLYWMLKKIKMNYEVTAQALPMNLIFF
jgi:hypothetical protein